MPLAISLKHKNSLFLRAFLQLIVGVHIFRLHFTHTTKIVSSMSDGGPAAKRSKRDKFAYDFNSEDDEDSAIRDMEMDSDGYASTVEVVLTSDESGSENDWSSKSSNHSERVVLNHKPFVLKVPRGKVIVPESVRNPGSTMISGNQQNALTPDQFRALDAMPLDHMCIFAETSKAFKEIALKFFAMKYRNMKLEMLANPINGTLCL